MHYAVRPGVYLADNSQMSNWYQSLIEVECVIKKIFSSYSDQAHDNTFVRRKRFSAFAFPLIENYTCACIFGRTKLIKNILK